MATQSLYKKPRARTQLVASQAVCCREGALTLPMPAEAVGGSENNLQGEGSADAAYTSRGC